MGGSARRKPSRRRSISGTERTRTMTAPPTTRATPHAPAALDAATPSRVRPRIWRTAHAAIPAAAVAIAFASWAPLPPLPPRPPAAPGTETVQMAEIKGLEKVILLEQMDARDDAQR